MLNLNIFFHLSARDPPTPKGPSVQVSQAFLSIAKLICVLQLKINWFTGLGFEKKYTEMMEYKISMVK